MRPITVLLLATLIGLSQQPIRVDVNLVTVACSVRDAQGRLAARLTKDDFELLEDGVPQTIRYFSRSSDLPLTLGLLVDASESQADFVKRHHHDIESFLRGVLGPRDQAFLVCFGNHLRLVSDLSGSSARLLTGLKGFEHGNRDYPELGPFERRILGTAFYDAIYYGAGKLTEAGMGRKALVVFSDGEDNSSAHHMLDAIESAQQADVLLYDIRYTEHARNGWTARNKYGMRVMERLARETGGAEFDALHTDLRTAFRQIDEELRSLYELAYTSNASHRESGFRKLTIRMKQPGLQVRAKTGYFVRGSTGAPVSGQ